MRQAEARRIVWKRLAETARNDVMLGDWISDEATNAADQRRIEKACIQVAKSIEARLAKAQE